MVQGRAIDRGIDPAPCEQGGEGGCKAQPAIDLCHVERLDPHAVASKDNPTVSLVGNSKGEHAVELLDAVRAPGVERLQNDLGVSMREEAVALFDELAAQFLIVVDATIENDCKPEIGIDHGLGRQVRSVDDFQSSMA